MREKDYYSFFQWHSEAVVLKMCSCQQHQHHLRTKHQRIYICVCVCVCVCVWSGFPTTLSVPSLLLYGAYAGLRGFGWNSHPTLRMFKVWLGYEFTQIITVDP